MTTLKGEAKGANSLSNDGSSVQDASRNDKLRSNMSEGAIVAQISQTRVTKAVTAKDPYSSFGYDDKIKKSAEPAVLKVPVFDSGIFPIWRRDADLQPHL